LSFPALTDNALPEPRTDGYSFGTNVETIDTNVLSPDKQAAANAGTPSAGTPSAGTPSPDGRAPATTLARTIIGQLYKPGG
jgi:hypothetical protein